METSVSEATQTGLAGSLERISHLQDRTEIRHGAPADPSWTRCTDLLENPVRFTQWQKLLTEWLLEHHGKAPARTAASYIMTWYLHVPAFLGALLLHHERRVPMLNPDELALRLATDRPHPEGIALASDRFYCLPSDPESNLAEATIVADEQALAAILRARYTAHAARFARSYSSISPLGPRTVWAAATDALDNCLWLAGRHSGDEGAGAANAALVLDKRHAPLTSASTLQVIENAEGQREWWRRRESCCFSYLLPNEPECDNCPRICPKF